jgi:DNA-binding transcriptional regulator PaaX
MGKLEKRNTTQIRRTKINTAIIAVVAAAGMIALAGVAPALVGVFGRGTYLRQRMYSTRSKISRLIAAGYLTRERKDGQTFLRLTEKGERFAALMQEGELAPKKPRHWDGKWRLLIFDIPEGRRRVRGQIRETLVKLGFVRLQDSVWAFPYSCEDYITILKADLKIGKDVLYIIADQIENDAPLRSHFNLPKQA